jgi:Rad3-related DNA helicase
MLKYIEKGLAKDAPHHARRLILAFGKKREEQIQQHFRSSEPTVLAASGLWEGADLHGDRSRFQIIPSMPRAALTPQVQARMRLDPKWYGLRTCMKLLQGCGRSIRSETDAACTYLLDVDFKTECRRKYGNRIPKWVQDAIQFVGEGTKFE